MWGHVRSCAELNHTGAEVCGPAIATHGDGVNDNGLSALGQIVAPDFEGPGTAPSTGKVAELLGNIATHTGKEARLPKGDQTPLIRSCGVLIRQEFTSDAHTLHSLDTQRPTSELDDLGDVDLRGRGRI
jgi:hypothetical protein